MSDKLRTIIITGGAGYVGEILCDKFSKRADVEKIIVIDRAPQTDFLKQLPKVIYLETELADNTWQESVRQFSPNTIIHTAWQIRAHYGKSKEQWRTNVEGTKAVFAFAFNNSSVTKLVHFSTAASYGAYPQNSITHFFTEAEGLRADEYIYAKEKKAVEDELWSRYQKALATGKKTPQITIIRPAAITGPRGRFLRTRFGLQSALRGDLHKTALDKIVSLLTTFFPVTKSWVRQFIHEDDVANLVEQFVFTEQSWSYEAFNGTPVGEPVFSQAMAEAVGKRRLFLPPFVIQIAFAFFWHATRGKIPTCPHSWRFYAYPILLDGNKLAKEYRCQYDSLAAITYSDGYYESFIPAELKKSKPPVTK